MSGRGFSRYSARMKKINLLLFVVLGSLLSQISRAETHGLVQVSNQNPSVLFDKWLDALEAPLVRATGSNDAVDQLVAEGSSRGAAFNIQALGRTFSAIDPAFSSIRFDFKMIEDGLGQMDKWATLDNEAKQAEAKKTFAAALKEGKWYGKKSRILEIRKTIHALAAKVKNPEAVILKELANAVIEIFEKPYDFSGLEADNGLHEYKREIRWFLIQARTLDGMVSFKPNQGLCPNPDLFKVYDLKTIQKSKYSQLPAAQVGQYTCAVSACLFYGLSSTVESIDSVKADAEHAIGNSDSDMTPPQLKVKAEKIYNRINKTNVFNLLAAELNECAQ